MAKLVKTGIAGLDEFLQGGLPSRVILLSGVPGSGNEVFARQTAYVRAKQNAVTYFTVNNPSDFVKEDMASYGWDVTPLEETGAWKFINLKKANSIVNTVVKQIKEGRAIVIDSLSELLLTHEMKEVVNLLTVLAVENREIKEMHLLLLTEGMHNNNVEITMEHFAEGVIIFYTNWTGDSIKRDLLIKKMRGSLSPSRKLPYKIGKKGFIIETATRIT
jgi:KaiC/GvpD/RAD55 family RecA-like ATPase